MCKPRGEEQAVFGSPVFCAEAHQACTKHSGRATFPSKSSSGGMNVRARRHAAQRGLHRLLSAQAPRPRVPAL